SLERIHVCTKNQKRLKDSKYIKHLKDSFERCFTSPSEARTRRVTWKEFTCAQKRLKYLNY
ncbi:MAG: hypothetical protein Harvfovirus26_1, partial [Harvfovirus sp.]